MACPHKAGRAGHDALCYQCACAKPCPGVRGKPCKFKAGRCGLAALCYRCVPDLPPEEEAKLLQFRQQMAQMAQQAQQSVQVVVPPGVNPGQRMRVRVSSQVSGRH